MRLKARGQSAVAWGTPAAIVLAAAALTALAPVERTLGDGIRVVYLHVALTWAGAVGLAVAGLLGGGVALTASAGLPTWMRAAGWVGWGLYLAGFLVSILAAQVNWGGVNALFWREPRTVGAMQVLAVALIVQVAQGFVRPARVRGALSAGLAAFTVWMRVGDTAGVLHPRDAVGASESQAIRLVFLGMFALACLFGVWGTWMLRRRVRRA